MFWDALGGLECLSDQRCSLVIVDVYMTPTWTAWVPWLLPFFEQQLKASALLILIRSIYGMLLPHRAVGQKDRFSF